MAPPGGRLVVVIPSYQSERTVGGCLKALEEQTFDDFEAIIVDSSPTPETAEFIKLNHPWVRVIVSRERLLPHAARNLGVAESQSELLVFTDPDIYPQPDWLARMVAAYDRHGGVVVGSVACHNADWLSQAIHVTKFDLWLPNRPAGTVEISLTGNMLIDRPTFNRLGAFDGERMLADTLFSWCLERHGVPKHLIPEAIVLHDHRQGIGSFVSERFIRGQEFGWLRMGWWDWRYGRVAVQLLVTLLPLRLVNLVARNLANAVHFTHAVRLVGYSPIVLLGQAAWLAGELSAYWRWMLGRLAERQLRCGS